jgi:hypothetical protein
VTRARDVANIDGLLTTKGDIYAATAAATPARLGVGSNGETLVADSSTSTGLRYQATQAAGKNYQINGGFDNWQRSTSSTTVNAYATADRWYQAGGGTVTYSRDTDVPANQGFTYSAKWLTGASSSYGEWYSALEAQDVSALSGRTVTLSYWLKTSGAFSGAVAVELQLGTVANTLLSGTWTTSAIASAITPTSTWTRYQATGTITAGTVGLRVRQVLSTAQASGIGLFITGVQIELGSVATTFSRAGGTIQGELAACQRYYQVHNRGGFVTAGQAVSTTTLYTGFQFVQTMRTAPTITLATAGQTSGTVSFLIASGGYPATTGTHSTDNITAAGFQMGGTGYSAAFTAGNASLVYSNGTSNIYTASAEL